MFLMREMMMFHGALADASRLRLLNLIKDGEICVCFLQGVLQTNQPKISRHLAYLRKAGLVEARREGKWMHYRLKKPDSGLEAILSETLKALQKLPQIKADVLRLTHIRCCPSRYGFSSPLRNKVPSAKV
jgi:ArsR family transcriptional regulator